MEYLGQWSVASLSYPDDAWWDEGVAAAVVGESCAEEQEKARLDLTLSRHSRIYDNKIVATQLLLFYRTTQRPIESNDYIR